MRLAALCIALHTVLLPLCKLLADANTGVEAQLRLEMHLVLRAVADSNAATQRSIYKLFDKWLIHHEAADLAIPTLCMLLRANTQLRCEVKSSDVRRLLSLVPPPDQLKLSAQRVHSHVIALLSELVGTAGPPIERSQHRIVKVLVERPMIALELFSTKLKYERARRERLLRDATLGHGASAVIQHHCELVALIALCSIDCGRATGHRVRSLVSIDDILSAIKDEEVPTELKRSYLKVFHAIGVSIVQCFFECVLCLRCTTSAVLCRFGMRRTCGVCMCQRPSFCGNRSTC